MRQKKYQTQSVILSCGCSEGSRFPWMTNERNTLKVNVLNEMCWSSCKHLALSWLIRANTGPMSSVTAISNNHTCSKSINTWSIVWWPKTIGGKKSLFIYLPASQPARIILRIWNFFLIFYDYVFCLQKLQDNNYSASNLWRTQMSMLTSERQT